MSIDDVQADLVSHHIEGIAVHGDTPFSMPLISHITGNLWTGGCIDGVRLPDDFAHVVSLYPWERFELGPNTQRTEARLYDAAELPDVPKLFMIAGHVLGCLQEGKTLVHCQAGLNRSGLVAGLALVMAGLGPGTAIDWLRYHRSPAVLCNPVFESFLSSLELRP